MESSLKIHTKDVLSYLTSDPEMNTTSGSPRTVWSMSSDNSTGSPKKAFLPCNNPENIIDEATAERVESLLQMTVLPLLELFGVVINVINCMVFVRQGLKDRINLCLFSLSVADISFLVFMFSAKFFSFLGLFDEDLEEYWSGMSHSTVLGPLFGTMTISNLMTMIIALERCICVLSPFRAKRFLKTRYMLVLIVTMGVYVLGVYSLLNMKYVTLRVTDSVTKTSHWVLRLGSFYLEHRLVIDVLYNHLLILTIPCLSVLVVVVATCLTVTTLSQKLAWRQETAAGSRKEDSLGVKREMAVTKMLVMVCIMYVVTTIPSVTQRFFRTLVPGYVPSGKYCNLFVVVQTLVHVCEVANSSLNFIVYFSMGSRFRATLRQLLGRGPKENKMSSSTQP